MANAATATYSGRTIIWERMMGSNSQGNNIGWGQSNATFTFTGSANANVNLFFPATEARTAGTATLVTTSYLGDTYRVIGTITCAVGAKTITEVGLFDTTTLSTTTTLSASLTAAATSMTLAANVGPTSGAYYAQIGNETVLVTGANSTTLTIARGSLGSSSAIQVSGTPVTIGGDGTNANNNAALTTGQTAAVPASLGGNMFVHADFAGIALNVNDSIAFTITDTLT